MSPAALEVSACAATSGCSVVAAGAWAAEDVVEPAALAPSDAGASAASAAELPLSPEPLESVAGVDVVEASGVLDASVVPAGAAELVASDVEPESAGAVAAGADETAVADEVSAGVEDDPFVVEPPAGVVVVAGAVGWLTAAGGDAPPPPLGVELDDGEDPPVVPELEVAAVDAVVGVEVAPLDVAGVEETEDEGAPVAVEVTVPGSSTGVPIGTAGELLVGPAARDGIDATSRSRAVGGAVAR